MNFEVKFYLQFPRTERYYAEVQVQLNSNAEDLNQAATDIVSASRQAPQHVAHASNRFSRAYEDFMGTGQQKYKYLLLK